MTWSKDIFRRLTIFYVVIIGCMGVAKGVRGFMLEQGVELTIAGPTSLFVFLFLLIWSSGQLKFERI